MARLALVSRNPIMAMGLSAADHDIIEVRPNSLDEWLATGNDADVDALVLDLGSPVETLRVVGDLRAEGRWTPVLIVASSPTGWDSPDLLALPGVDLLTLPIDAARLQTASDAVLRHPKAAPAMVRSLNSVSNREPLIEEVDESDEVAEPAFLADAPDSEQPLEPETAMPIAPMVAGAEPGAQEPEPASAVLVESSELTPASPSPSPPEPPAPEPKVEERTVEQLAVATEPVAAASPPPPAPIPVRDVVVEEEAAAKKAPKRRKKVDQVGSEPQPVTKVKQPRARKKPKADDSSPPIAPVGKAPVSKARKSRKQAAGIPSHPRRRATDRLPDQGPGEVVGTLLESTNVLYTLSETAEVIVEDAIDRAGATSGALLVPDGDAWRVAAGVGLRTLEYRYQLTAESWLIERVGESHRGLLIENSDVARQALHGAPLASRAHLLAVPVPDVTAVLVLSRDEDPPFTESVLGALAQLAKEAGPLLQRAIDLRALSRGLAKHLDPEEAPRD